MFPIPQAPSAIAHRGKLPFLAAKPMSLEATGASPGSDFVLHRVCRPAEEMRSYRFYVDVTAPSMGGALDTRFWTREIPRVCHMNATIWHAVVSLGSVHEHYVSGKPVGSRPNGFALRHFNAAIAELTKPSARPQAWVALVASTLFTFVSILDGQLEQALLHFQAGCKLLLEAQKNASETIDSDSSDSDDQAPMRRTSSPDANPVALSSLHSILLNFETLAAKLDVKTTSQPPKLLTPKSRYSAWETYQFPQLPPAFGRCFTARNLGQAVAAAESMFMSLVISFLRRGIVLRQLYSQGGFDLLGGTAPYRDPVAVTEGFIEIQQGIDMFRSELDRGLKIRPTEMKELRKAYLSLCFIHNVNRFMLSHDPDEPDEQKRREGFPALCERSIDLVEHIYRLESKVGCLRSGGETVTTATVMNPLMFLAKTGFDRATRERAIRLLYVPRVEGVWDSHMTATIAHRMLVRETAATREYRMQPHLDDVVIDHPTARGWDVRRDDREFIHPLGRIANYNMSFTGSKEAVLYLRTWKEWLEGSPGTESLISW